MFKAIIADDEEWTRKSLRKQADWEGIGISVVGEAKNGAVAMELVEQWKPDIVITDIRMPVMDGMKLMEWLNDRYPQVLVIVISGYSEFEYAKKALSLHAFDYILKPIESGPLADTLERAAAKLSRDLDDKRQAALLNRKVHESAVLSKEKFLMNLVLGALPGDKEIRSGMARYGLPNDWARMAVLVVAAENFDAIAERSYRKDKELTGFVLANIIGELVQDRMNAILFRNYGNPNELIAILELTTLDDQAGMDMIYSGCRQIIDTAEQATPFKFRIGVGREFTSLRDASRSYGQASEAVRNAGFMGVDDDSIIHIDEISSRNDYMMYPGDKEKELIYYVENAYKTQALQAIEDLFRDIGSSRTVHPQSIRESVLGLVIGMNKALNRYGMNLETLLQETSVVDNLMSGLPSAETLKSRLGVMVSSSIDFLAENKKTGTRKQIGDIVSFLQEHYREEISLSGIADRWFLNPAYLSRMFKNEIGIPFNEYVTKLRMDAAAKLLQDPQLKMSDISEMIGYANEKYFLKKFKEFYDCTPTEHRNRSKKNIP